MARKTGLGRGLGALIPGGEEPQWQGSGVMEVPVEKIQPNPRQPRTRFHEEELEELAASIRQHGVIQPLILSHSEQGDGGFVLVAGERRLLAARLAGLETVPALVREAGDQQRLELALIENVQRSDLTPLEAAEAYRQLTEEFHLSHEDVSERVGKSRVAVTNTLRLLKLPQAVQQALAEGQISEGHARALLALSTPQAQNAALQTILKQGLNVRQTEELVRRLSGQKPVRKEKPGPSPEVLELEERLEASLGTRVTLNRRGKGGTLVIHFYSDEELNALIERFIEENADSI